MGFMTEQKLRARIAELEAAAKPKRPGEDVIRVSDLIIEKRDKALEERDSALLRAQQAESRLQELMDERNNAGFDDSALVEALQGTNTNLMNEIYSLKYEIDLLKQQNEVLLQAQQAMAEMTAAGEQEIAFEDDDDDDEDDDDDWCDD